MPGVNIDSIVRSWVLSGISELNRGASTEQIQFASHVLGRPLPEDLVRLYELCNGGHILEGNIGLYPLDDSELSLIEASDFLREYNWPIPPELVVFGDNGLCDNLGLWLPKEGNATPVVVEVGQIFKGGSFAVTGTSLSRFLLGRTAYYLLLCECPSSALEPLDVPLRFQAKNPKTLNDNDYDALMRWADVALPNRPLSSYDARLTVDELARYAQSI